MNSEAILDKLYKFGGMDRQAFAGTQFDIMQTTQHGPDGLVRDKSLCTHTCAMHVTVPDSAARKKGNEGAMKTIPTGGCYACGSSAANNKGLDANGLASLEQMVEWMTVEAGAQKIFHELFLQNHFDQYIREFEIDPEAAVALRTAYQTATVLELNGFGGSPGKHKEALSLLRWAKAQGMRANLTDTGREFLSDDAFVTQFFANPPNVLALSFDDLTPAKLAELHALKLEEIKELWKTAMREEPYHGQLHKALEGVYAGKLVYDKLVAGNESPPILVMFNCVIHSGNVGHLRELVATIAHLMPKARLNPYPAQSSFADNLDERVPCWKPEDLPALEASIDWLRAETLSGNPNITVRLHYYNFLKAQFNRFRGEPEVQCARMSGFDGWRPDRRPGAYRYSEISGSAVAWGESLIHPGSPKTVRSFGKKKQAGGHPGSYWYQWAIGGSKQVHEYSPLELAQERLAGKFHLIEEQAPHFKGHNMPRLTFVTISTELGMDPEVVPEYLKLRRETFGY